MLGLDVKVVNNICLITFCNTKKNNALTVDNYDEIANILNQHAINDAIIATIFTGKDEYFTSGTDLSMKTDETETDGVFDMGQLAENFNAKFVRMVHALLRYPKLIISVVNGPAIGIGLTLVALSDIAYASDTAIFSAPFVKLGLCIEGCGSYLLPRIMGKSKASEVLLLGHKMVAAEAKAFNLVTKIVKRQDVNGLIQSLINELADVPLEQLMYNKKLITDNLMDDLLECAKREAKVLLECQTSGYFLSRLMNFASKKRSML